MPLMAILVTHQNHSGLLAARSEDQLSDYLASLQDARIDAASLLAMSRQATDSYDFGLACFRKYGEAVELDRWNEALQHFGERSVQNTNAANEFAEHVQAALPALRSILASVFRTLPVPPSSRTSIAELESTACPSELVLTRWKVRFDDAMGAFASFFEGIDASFDPLEAARQNRRNLQKLVPEFQEIGVAWAVGISATLASSWESRTESFMAALDETLATTGYLTMWSEEEAFILLKGLPRDEESQSFWGALEQSNNLGQLKQFLEITPERLARARRDLFELREQTRRQSRLISVCGREFDGSDDNFPSLWSHITTVLPDAVLATLSNVELTVSTPLASPPKRKPSGKGSGGGYRHPATPKGQESLVGLTGEIHAFRQLKHQYGSHIVSASAWLSSNSLHVYPDQTCVDDSAGCDSRFVVKGKTYHIEVKASSGEDDMFTFGSSEIRLAMGVSKSKQSRRRGVFMLLRVLRCSTLFRSALFSNYCRILTMSDSAISTTSLKPEPVCVIALMYRKVLHSHSDSQGTSAGKRRDGSCSPLLVTERWSPLGAGASLPKLR